MAELIFPLDYTAIVSFRDEVAYPVMYALRGQRISIPGDVSIISFDNLGHLRICTPDVSCRNHCGIELRIIILRNSNNMEH